MAIKNFTKLENPSLLDILFPDKDGIMVTMEEKFGRCFCKCGNVTGYENEVGFSCKCGRKDFADFDYSTHHGKYETIKGSDGEIFGRNLVKVSSKDRIEVQLTHEFLPYIHFHADGRVEVKEMSEEIVLNLPDSEVKNKLRKLLSMPCKFPVYRLSPQFFDLFLSDERVQKVVYMIPNTFFYLAYQRFDFTSCKAFIKDPSINSLLEHLKFSPELYDYWLCIDSSIQSVLTEDFCKDFKKCIKVFDKYCPASSIQIQHLCQRNIISFSDILNLGDFILKIEEGTSITNSRYDFYFQKYKEDFPTIKKYMSLFDSFLAQNIVEMKDAIRFEFMDRILEIVKEGNTPTENSIESREYFKNRNINRFPKASSDNMLINPLEAFASIK